MRALNGMCNVQRAAEKIRSLSLPASWSINKVSLRALVVCMRNCLLARRGLNYKLYVIVCSLSYKCVRAIRGSTPPLFSHARSLFSTGSQGIFTHFPIEQEKSLSDAFSDRSHSQDFCDGMLLHSLRQVYCQSN